MTKYLVLAKTDDGDWHVVGERAASSARAAIRAILNGTNGGEGTFVGVPARSFKPITAKFETKVKFG